MRLSPTQQSSPPNTLHVIPDFERSSCMITPRVRISNLYSACNIISSTSEICVPVGQKRMCSCAKTKHHASISIRVDTSDSTQKHVLELHQNKRCVAEQEHMQVCSEKAHISLYNFTKCILVDPTFMLPV